MKMFETPEIEVVKFLAEDVITTSVETEPVPDETMENDTEIG